MSCFVIRSMPLITASLLSSLVGCAGDTSLETTALDEGTCTVRAAGALDDCTAACDANYGNDELCERAADDAHEANLAALRAATDATGDKPQAVYDLESCVAAIDAEPACSGVADEISRTFVTLGQTYSFDPGFVTSVIGTLGQGTCDFGRTVARTGCYLDKADDIASYYGTSYGDLGGRYLDVAGSFLGMLGNQAGCFFENAGNDVQHFGCIGVGYEGADIGFVDIDVETGCYHIEEDTFSGCRGECAAPEGSSCVPAGKPAWIDCGYYDQDLEGSCGCVGDVVFAGVCRDFEVQSALPWNRVGQACQLTIEGKQVAAENHYVVHKDAGGKPTGGSVQCIAVDQFRIPCLTPGQQSGCPASADL